MTFVNHVDYKCIMYDIADEEDEKDEKLRAASFFLAGCTIQDNLAVAKSSPMKRMPATTVQSVPSAFCKVSHNA